MTEGEFETYILPCHQKMFGTAAVILGDREEASDTVQEAFARLWERRDDIPNPQNPDGYCQTVIKRMCIDRLRRRRHQEVSLEDVLEPGGESILPQLEAGDSLRRVEVLLGKLPASQSRVIRMSAISGLDNAEIADATGLTQVNVRALLSRGRKMLKKMFEKEI